MTEVSMSEAGVVVDATLVAKAFGIAPDVVRQEMRDGTITSQSETGVAEDAGRMRVTFYREDRVFRLVIAETGEILSRATFPVLARRRSAPPDVD
ncbi:DUF6522 family protein [Tritonibacter scottomollicae]|uniref:DUF6522 family protein n=1 Tax=Tritonibacter scottomollicae TaxID=483013 RepID=UPI003BA8766D